MLREGVLLIVSGLRNSNNALWLSTNRRHSARGYQSQAEQQHQLRQQLDSDRAALYDMRKYLLSSNNLSTQPYNHVNHYQIKHQQVRLVWIESMTCWLSSVKDLSS